MAINISTLAPASLKSKNVATEQYVDTAVASIDVSSDINANNETFAKAQGFISYSDMVNKYSALGKTVISGGYINTGLVKADSIVTGAITADKINTTGLVAQNVMVPGINSNNPLFSASGDKVVISNLKVIGTASLPGISKAGSFVIPNLGCGTTHSVIINKPYECQSWSVLLNTSLSNNSGSGETTDFYLTVSRGGTVYATSQSVSIWASTTSASTAVGGITDGSVTISIRGDGSGSYHGNIGYVAIVEY